MPKKACKGAKIGKLGSQCPHSRRECDLEFGISVVLGTRVLTDELPHSVGLLTQIPSHCIPIIPQLGSFTLHSKPGNRIMSIKMGICTSLHSPHSQAQTPKFPLILAAAPKYLQRLCHSCFDAPL
jgi:hypothetical protein